MKLLRCLLIDDELPALDELSYLLSHIPNTLIAGTESSAGQALQSIKEHTPDIVFLDIQLPGQTGFQILHQAASLPQPPLFILATAYSQYAVRAFEENVIDYLMKPITTERLNKALTRARARLLEQTEQTGVPPNRIPPRLAVEQHGRVLLLTHHDVLFLRTEERRILIRTSKAWHVLHGTNTLDRLEGRLTPFGFFRANRADLINLEQIRNFTPWFNGKYILTMTDDDATEISVSKNRVRGLRQSLNLV